MQLLIFVRKDTGNVVRESESMPRTTRRSSALESLFKFGEKFAASRITFSEGISVRSSYNWTSRVLPSSLLQ